MSAGLGVPPHPFFRGLLHHYQIELQHLNLNRVQQITAFIMMSEGFLGNEPYFKLWRYFFAISLVRKRDRSTALIGYTEIHLRGPRAHEYMAITTTKSNKGWHSRWFYIKNYDVTPRPLFTGHTIVAAPPMWSWGPMDKEKKRLAPLLGAIAYPKGYGLYGASVVDGVRTSVV
jgi:hypothetical protein